MLDRLTAQPADALLALIKLYAADPAADKIDLGVGVYRTADGATPVFRAIKAAERKLVEMQDSKAYLGPEGDMGFVRALAPRVFAGTDVLGRVDGLQTPGGTGAVRLAADLLKAAGTKRMFLGVPSWPNHAQILKAVGLPVETFTHADIATQTIDFDATRAALASAGEGDAFLLHGCCHNPTGLDYSEAQWDEIAETLVARQIFPVIDLAYHGLGQGWDADNYGLRAVLAKVPQALVAYSCDKNFGLYRDRVGAIYIVAKDADGLPAIVSNAAAFARANWSMPPDHGAAAVRLILEDESLTADWLAEVDEMRARMREVRDALAGYGMAGSVDLKPLQHQNGLFSTLPLNADQIKALRDDHAIYMAGSGRINIAGLTMHNLPKFVAALAAVTA